MALTQTQEECPGMSGVETSGFHPLGDPSCSLGKAMGMMVVTAGQETMAAE